MQHVILVVTITFALLSILLSLYIALYKHGMFKYDYYKYNKLGDYIQTKYFTYKYKDLLNKVYHDSYPWSHPIAIVGFNAKAIVGTNYRKMKGYLYYKVLDNCQVISLGETSAEEFRLMLENGVYKFLLVYVEPDRKVKSHLPPWL